MTVVDVLSQSAGMWALRYVMDKNGLVIRLLTAPPQAVT